VFFCGTFSCFSIGETVLWRSWEYLETSGNIWNHGDILCRRLCAAGVRCAGGAKEPEFLHESRYPLVICYITMERSTIFNG
jgi:hypothetical protein